MVHLTLIMAEHFLSSYWLIGEVLVSGWTYMPINMPLLGNVFSQSKATNLIILQSLYCDELLPVWCSDEFLLYTWELTIWSRGIRTTQYDRSSYPFKNCKNSSRDITSQCSKKLVDRIFYLVWLSGSYSNRNSSISSQGGRTYCKRFWWIKWRRCNSWNDRW